MNQENSADEVIVERRGAAGCITLNRPRALNALSLNMIRTVSAALQRWEADDSVKVVYFEGAGNRAFCAGGDLRLFYHLGMQWRRGHTRAEVPALFFGEEYSLNSQIFHYSKPIVAFMNGITMGGGFGIAGHCKFRIATERTVFAMPEVGIGFFPDVGAVYHLLRCRGNSGRYLALTGLSIGPADMVHMGLAEGFIGTEMRADILKMLEKGELPVLDAKAVQGDPGDVQIYAPAIEKIFSLPDVPSVLKALEEEGSDWAAKIFNLLHRRSPSSLMVTAEQLRRAADKDFDEVIATDFILAQHFLERPDLYEGIRSVIIDKDNQPRWTPATIDDVVSMSFSEYFKPTSYELKDVRIY